MKSLIICGIIELSFDPLPVDAQALLGWMDMCRVTAAYALKGAVAEKGVGLTMEVPASFRILSLDGGGAKGGLR